MRTLLDSGVLLTAWRGLDAHLALAIMDDPARTFVTSDLVKLELLPKPTCFKQHLEVEFYETHFAAAERSLPLTAALARNAQRLAAQYGLAAIDALHIAAAIRLRAKVFITTELPEKPLFRVREIEVQSLTKVTSSTK